MNCRYYIYVYVFNTFVDFAKSTLPDYYLDDKKYYGDGYGTKWIYFPDGDGVLRYVNLTVTGDDGLQMRHGYDEIEFKLYIGNDTKSYITLDERGKSIEKSYQNITSCMMSSKMPLKLVTHGWMSTADTSGVFDIKTAYLETQNVIVITVDWSDAANSIFYYTVAIKTKSIGARIALFLNKLNEQYNVSGNQIHLIGHSLGAHVMGVAASESSLSVNRVTGLDPARPFFEFPSQGNSAKIDSKDAEFVDIIHTCGGLLGVEAPVGTVDFYPNNGIAPQPGCDSIIKIFEACSHGRSFGLFVESIKYPKSFPSYQCQSWPEFLENKCHQSGYMGDGVNRSMSGKYYLKTNAFEPFGTQTRL